MPSKNTFALSRKNVAFFLVLVILLFGAYTFLSWPRCSELREIPASVEVRTAPGRAFLGFNTDTDSLKFGGVSPNAEVVRSMNVQYPFDAEVRLVADGTLASWLSINPAMFTLAAQEPQQVTFRLLVPPNVYDGNYTGMVRICFRKE
ncbi:hypothetical protein HYS49_02215 [Candidatus Woesearchaeota archaeon]|nr:hypothetical protein [Candidatus Woesearchaeota archaeon]